MKTLLIAFGILFATPAWADRVVVHHMAVDHFACPYGVEGPQVYACTMPSRDPRGRKGICEVWIGKLPKPFYRKVFRHEMAHCNGLGPDIFY